MGGMAPVPARPQRMVVNGGSSARTEGHAPWQDPFSFYRKRCCLVGSFFLSPAGLLVYY